MPFALAARNRKIGVVQRAAPQLSLFPEEHFPPPGRPGALPGFSVRVSGRARRLSIKVYPRGRVEVVVPRRTRPGDVQRFVDENREWIHQARHELAGDLAYEAFALPQRIALPAIATTLSVAYVETAGARSVRWRLDGERLTLSGRTSDATRCVEALRRCLSSLAKAAFAPRLAALSRARSAQATWRESPTRRSPPVRAPTW